MATNRHPRERFFTRLIWATVALAIVSTVFAVSILGVGDGLGSPPTIAIWAVVVLALQYMFIGGSADEDAVSSRRGRFAVLLGTLLLFAPLLILGPQFFYAIYDGILVMRGGFLAVPYYYFFLPALLGWAVMLVLIWRLGASLCRYGMVRLVFWTVLGNAVWHACLDLTMAWVAEGQFQIQFYKEEFHGRFIVTQLDEVAFFAVVYVAVALPWAFGVGAYLVMFNPKRRHESS